MQFVAAGAGAEPIWKHLNRQVYLGSDAYVQRMQDKGAGHADGIHVPHALRRPPPPSLEAIATAHSDRDAAMLAAHRTGEYGYAEIARHFGIHLTMVGQRVAGAGDESRPLARMPRMYGANGLSGRDDFPALQIENWIASAGKPE